MKQEIPKPVVIGVAIAVLAVAAFFIFRNAGSTQEFEAPPITGEMPDYIKNAINKDGSDNSAPKSPSENAAAGQPPVSGPQPGQPTANPYGN